MRHLGSRPSCAEPVRALYRPLVASPVSPLRGALDALRVMLCSVLCYVLCYVMFCVMVYSVNGILYVTLRDILYVTL